MIFKIKNNKIYEGFDFNGIKVTSHASEEFNETPEIIRTVTNGNVTPEDVCLGLYGVSLPAGFRKYIRNIDTLGNVCSRQEENFDTLSKGAWNYLNMTTNDESKLKSAGFKEINLNFGGNRQEFSVPEIFNKLDNIHPAVADVISAYLMFRCSKMADPKSDPDPRNKIWGAFYISPDNGIIIIEYLGYECIHQDIYADQLALFTGAVGYEIEKPDKKTERAIKKKRNNILKAKKLVHKLIEEDGFDTLNYFYNCLKDPVKTANDAVIFPFDRSIERYPFYHYSATTEQEIKRKLFNSEVALYSFSRESSLKYYDIWKTYSADVDLVPLIEQFNYQTGEIAAGYRGESAKWCIYYISDLEKIKKLIEEEAAKELSPMPVVFDAGGSNKPEFSVYSFIFIPKSDILGDLAENIQSVQLPEI